MSAGPLFDYRPAENAAQIGMQRAADHAERVEPGWGERAYTALESYIASHAEFTAEEAREALHAGGLSLPPDGRAWGAVFKRAAGRKLIVKIGYAPRRCGNMTPTIIWARAAT